MSIITDMTLQNICRRDVFAQFEVCNIIPYRFEPVLSAFLIVQNRLKSDIVLVKFFLVFLTRFQLGYF